jgi:hypothetical protein
MNKINDPKHNPFHNRFHVPVHSRLDEMQAYTHMAWLHSPIRTDQQKTDQHPRHYAGALAGAFALVLVVVFSAALLAG